MGARLYNPSTGTFTSMDPVFGGNSTTYAYPFDPVNGYDIAGECWGCGTLKSIGKAAWKHRGTAVNVAGAIAGGAAVGSCVASVACAVAVGAAAGAATYLTHQAVTGEKVTVGGLATNSLIGAAGGGAAKGLQGKIITEARHSTGKARLFRPTTGGKYKAGQ
jgi:hypothetical protein